MKKIISFLTAFILIFNLPINANAKAIPVDDAITTDEKIQMVDLGNGFTIKYQTTEIAPNARASTKKAVKTATCEYDGKTVAIVKLTASFSYTGSSATCTSATASYIMYDGWMYSNKSTTRSGNSATTSARMEKGSTYVNFRITMSCSPTGVIS